MTTKFEYLSLNIQEQNIKDVSHFNKYLTEYGMQGWELVAVSDFTVPTEGDKGVKLFVFYRLFFKRKVEQ